MPNTPGPWNFQEKNGYLSIVGADGDSVIADWDINDDSSVGIRVDQEKEVANFMLMAAAPELLEACRLMYRAWEQLLPCLAKGVVQDYELVLTKAPVACKAAIAKVEKKP